MAIYADKEGMDATTPHGKAMLHMAAVFAELERGMIRERVMAGLERAKAQGVNAGPAEGGPKSCRLRPAIWKFICCYSKPQTDSSCSIRVSELLR